LICADEVFFSGGVHSSEVFYLFRQKRTLVKSQ